jgi:hypothetical protein
MTTAAENPQASGVPLSADFDDPDAFPYFLWDDPMTNRELRERLRTASPPERTRLLAKILRQARDSEVWRFTTPQEVVSAWPDLARHLGRRRPFWEFLEARRGDPASSNTSGCVAAVPSTGRSTKPSMPVWRRASSTSLLRARYAPSCGAPATTPPPTGAGRSSSASGMSPPSAKTRSKRRRSGRRRTWGSSSSGCVGMA